jgi:hypothetical protein
MSIFSDPRISTLNIGVEGLVAVITIDARCLMWTFMQSGKKAVRLVATLEGDRIVLTGGHYGAHSLDAKLSSADRVIAHWRGYVQATEEALVGYPKTTTPWAVRS